jgi:hypothetical protein
MMRTADLPNVIIMLNVFQHPLGLTRPTPVG